MPVQAPLEREFPKSDQGFSDPMLMSKLQARCHSCTSETLAPTFCGLAATLPAGRQRYPETNSILFPNSFIVPPRASWHN